MPGVQPRDGRGMTDAREWRGAVGDVWAQEWRRTDRAFAGLAPELDRAIRAAAPTGRFRALDVGCGAGTTSIALARTRPDAAVLGVDLSPGLIAAAQGRARDLANLAFTCGDALECAVELGPFELVASRHGVMFFPDPAAAFGALRAATAPGGRLVFSCFADPALNDFAGPLARALGIASPAFGGRPGPFAFADPRVPAAILAASGWRLTGLDQISFHYRVGEGADALDDAVGFLSRIGPAAAAMRGTDGAGCAALATGLRGYLRGFLAGDAVDLHASAWLVSAQA